MISIAIDRDTDSVSLPYIWRGSATFEIVIGRENTCAVMGDDVIWAKSGVLDRRAGKDRGGPNDGDLKIERSLETNVATESGRECGSNTRLAIEKGPRVMPEALQFWCSFFRQHQLSSDNIASISSVFAHHLLPIVGRKVQLVKRQI